jgi:fluoroacetyl-CoA thioesterase
MNPLANVKTGFTATRETVVTPELTVGHFVKGMPMVYGTPFMIMLMEMASGAAIKDHLPQGYVSVGTEVDIRHLAATPLGRTVRATARVTSLAPNSVEFAVEAFDGDRRIGEGRHRRGIVDLPAFEKRFGATKA